VIRIPPYVWNILTVLFAGLAVVIWLNVVNEIRMLRTAYRYWRKHGEQD
jgi:hypothetical protein